MYFLLPEYNPLGAVGLKAPGVAVGGLPGPRSPGLLQGGAPAGAEHLVQVGAHAHIRILRDQLQRTVPGTVKPPGDDPLHRHLSAPGPQPLRRAVVGAGVQHHHLVRLGHGVHPPVHKGALVLGDGVHHDFHSQPLLFKKRGRFAPSLKSLAAAGQSGGGNVPQPGDGHGDAAVLEAASRPHQL